MLRCAAGWTAGRSRPVSLLVCVAMMLGCEPAAAAWLSLCDGVAVEGAGTTYFDPSGRKRSLAVTPERPQSPGCATVQLPIGSDRIAWTGLVAPDVARAAEKGLVLTGIPTGKKFGVSEVGTPEAEPTTPAMIVPGLDLLARTTLRPFGVEERAELVRRENGVNLICGAGRRPAGFFAAPAALPPLAAPEIVLDYLGGGGFVLFATDGGRRRRDDPVALATLATAVESRLVKAAIPEGLDRSSPLGWSIACPDGGGRIDLARVVVESATPRRAESRAAWAWQPALWLEQPAELIARLRGYGIDRAYITVPLKDDRVVADPAALGAFIAQARAAGVAVWAVDGDPAAPLATERQRFVRRAQALAASNSAAPRVRKLAGVQFDIEPYLLPGYALKPDAWVAAYLATIEALRKAAGMPLEVALPFWFALPPATGQRLAAAVDSVAVMNYRTTPAEILSAAVPFLTWGVEHNRAVRIGLENGPIDDEERRVFTRADAGELWLLKLGEADALLLLQDSAAGLPGIPFAQQRASVVSGSKVSFRGDVDGLFSALPAISRALTNWPSFAGIALHGLF